MNKKLFFISFIINFVFSMLTTLLSLIVFNINKSTGDINIVMVSFIGSLLITRIFSISNFLKARTEIILGSILFGIGCLILVIDSNSMAWMLTGAILFGISIGLVPPAILVLLSETESTRSLNLGIYNAIVAIASVFSPIIGENIYTVNKMLLFLGWLIFSIIMIIISLTLSKKRINTTGTTINHNMIHNLKKVTSNEMFRISFVILLFSSITYGSIVAYLPIYFETINLSIGIYYLLFWSGYIMAQFIKRISYNFNTILLSLLFVIVGQLSLLFFKSSILIYIFSLVYGFGYGSLFKIFYVGIGNLNSEEERSIGFSIIGLISYIGVGIAPIFLIPFNANWETLFIGNLLYSTVGLVTFLFLRKTIIKRQS